MRKCLAIVLCLSLIISPCLAEKVTTSITNYTAGEFSPKLYGRYDISRYYNAAQTLLNWLILPAGGANRRPGTTFVGEVKDSSKSTRIVEFVFNVSQTYILEFGDQYLRIYTGGGRLTEATLNISGATQANPVVVTTTVAHGYVAGDWVVIRNVDGMTELNGKTYMVASPAGNTYALQDVDGNNVDGTGYTAYTANGVCNKILEVSTPYLEQDLFELQFAQSADVLYIVHDDYAPRTLIRSTATAWSLDTIDFEGGPFLPDNITALTITPSADAGNNITLTGSAPVFNSNHVGALWRVKDGIVKIDGYTSSTVVQGDVQANQDGTAGDLNTGPAATDDWAEGAWSIDEGYPSSVTFHEQRLVFASTYSSPQTLWGSYINVYTDFFGGATDSDSFEFTIATEQVNAIRWLSSGPKSLQIGTFGGTFSASSGSDNVPITPSNIVIQRDTTYGSANILPRRIGNFVYYIQRNLKVLRELGYNFDLDSQQAINMTLLSDHITGDDGVVDMAYQQAPNNVLWLVRDDGQVATLTRQIDQEVIGWARQQMGGSFDETAAGTAEVESVAAIPGLADDDEVWFVTKRTIDGNTRRYIEYLMPESFDELEDAFFVDCGLTYNTPITVRWAYQTSPVLVDTFSHGLVTGDQVEITGVLGMTELNDERFRITNVSQTRFSLLNIPDNNTIDGTSYTEYIASGEVRKLVQRLSGLDHLEGETVQILADGEVQDVQVVTNGTILLSTSATQVSVGLGYNSDIEGLPLTDGSPIGTARGKLRKIFDGSLLLYRTQGGQFGTEDDLYDIEYDSDTELYTGIKQMEFPGNWETEGEYFIRQSEPLPMTVLSVILNSEVQDR